MSLVAVANYSLQKVTTC